jgi:hypothetical protein
VESDFVAAGNGANSPAEPRQSASGRTLNVSSDESCESLQPNGLPNLNSRYEITAIALEYDDRIIRRRQSYIDEPFLAADFQVPVDDDH